MRPTYSPLRFPKKKADDNCERPYGSHTIGCSLPRAAFSWYVTRGHPIPLDNTIEATMMRFAIIDGTTCFPRPTRGSQRLAGPASRLGVHNERDKISKRWPWTYTRVDDRSRPQHCMHHLYAFMHPMCHNPLPTRLSLISYTMNISHANGTPWSQSVTSSSMHSRLHLLPLPPSLSILVICYPVYVRCSHLRIGVSLGTFHKVLLQGSTYHRGRSLPSGFIGCERVNSRFLIHFHP